MPRCTLVFMNSPLISPQPDFFDRLFYLYGDHIELMRFKEYYGMPRGHEQDLLYLLSIRNIYGLYIWSHLWYISRDKGDHYYTLTWHNDLFFPLQSYSNKTVRKNALRGLINTKQNVLMPSGHPIILLKFNLFNITTI